MFNTRKSAHKSTYIVAAPLLLLALAALSGCERANPLRPSNTTGICRDGVEYLMFEKMSSNASVSISVVPHFKADGSLYTCVEPVAKP